MLGDLANIVAPAEPVGIVHTEQMPEHSAFTVLQRRQAYQMVCEEVVSEPNETPEELCLGDADPAIALATLTKPGPFGPKTMQMGTYVGFRDGDSLVALGGERFAVPGFTEISGICTHPDYRGRGYADIIVRWLCVMIQGRLVRTVSEPHRYLLLQYLHTVRPCT